MTVDDVQDEPYRDVQDELYRDQEIGPGTIALALIALTLAIAAYLLG